MKQYPIFITMVILLFSCREQAINENIYSETYTVGKIPGLKSFETYNELDKRTEKILKSVDSLNPSEAFGKNRSRIFMESYSNGKKAPQDSAFYQGLPTPCYFEMTGDTLVFRVGIGFFGGMGVEIAIFKNKFQSSYFLYTDDVKPYKYNLSEDFTNNIRLKSKYQTLILNEQPTFKAGQQLTGYLTFTSPVFFERSLQNLDSNYVKGKLYFTCLTQ